MAGGLLGSGINVPSTSGEAYGVKGKAIGPGSYRQGGYAMSSGGGMDVVGTQKMYATGEAYDYGPYDDDKLGGGAKGYTGMMSSLFNGLVT